MEQNFPINNAILKLCQFMPHGVVAVKNGKIVWLNKEAEKVFKNALGKELICCFPTEYENKLGKLFEIARKKEGYFIKFYIDIMKDDKKIKLSAFLTYLDDFHFIIFGLEKNAVQNLMHNLKEKIKKLSCLYEIEKISKENENLDEILQRVTNIIPNILQHNELACCRLILNGKEYKSKNYSQPKLSISADIYINGKKKGLIEVGYPVDVPHAFFEEEKQTLQHIAMRVSDIIERIENKEEIWRSKAYFQALVEESSDIIMVIDEKTIVDYISPSIEKILGYKPEEIVGKSALEIVHPDDLKIALKKFEEVLNNPEKLVSAIFRVLHKDGKHIYANIKIRNLLENPVVNGIIVNFYNISELIEKRKALKEKENMLRALFNATHDLILLIKTDGTILEYNDAMERALGLKREEAIGKSIYDYKHLLDEKSFKRRTRYLKKVIETKKPVHFIDSRRGRWFDNTYYPILNEKGEVSQIAIFAKDITDLKEIEERFRQVVENANEWVWEVDENGLYTFSSPSIEKILGYKPEEIVGKMHFYDLFHPEDRERLKEEAFKVFREKKPFRGFLNRNLHKNGEEKWLLTSGVPILDENGNLKGYRGLDLDITERKKAKDELKKLNKFLESIIENANVWINALDENANVILWNRAAEEISGYKAEEVIGNKKIWEWLYPDENYRKKIIKKAMEIIKGKEVKAFETTITTKKGEKKIISWYSKNLLDDDGKIIGSVALGIDITEKRKAEKMAQTLINATHDLMLLAKTDGTILDLNDAMAKALGKKREEIIGTNIKEYLQDVYEYRTKKVKEVIKTKKPIHFIDSRRGRWFDHRFYPVFDENGNVVQIAVFSRDITEQKEMEEKLAEQKKLASLGRLAAVVAHELNTPLANILITAEYLSERLKGYEEELEIIKKEVRNASNIIKDILGFSKLKIKEKRNLNLRGVVDEAIEKVKRIEPVDDIIIQNRIDNLMVKGDRERLIECFVNIIKNAVMAKDESKANHFVIIEGIERDKEVEIIVRDNGVGMDEDVQKEALKPFFTTRPLGEGTGLGLFIANWVAEEHGGKIEINSKKGVGTEVKVRLKK